LILEALVLSVIEKVILRWFEHVHCKNELIAADDM